jgi:hypothetical protein
MWLLPRRVRLEPVSPRQQPHNLHETYQLPSLQLLISDDGHRRCPKHVEFRGKIKFWILDASCWLFIWGFYKVYWVWRHRRAQTQIRTQLHRSYIDFQIGYISTSTGKDKGHPKTCLRRHKEKAEISAKRVANSLRTRGAVYPAKVQAWIFNAKITPAISSYNCGFKCRKIKVK